MQATVGCQQWWCLFGKRNSTTLCEVQCWNGWIFSRLFSLKMSFGLLIHCGIHETRGLSLNRISIVLAKDVNLIWDIFSNQRNYESKKWIRLTYPVKWLIICMLTKEILSISMFILVHFVLRHIFIFTGSKYYFSKWVWNLLRKLKEKQNRKNFSVTVSC